MYEFTCSMKSALKPVSLGSIEGQLVLPVFDDAKLDGIAAELDARSKGTFAKALAALPLKGGACTPLETGGINVVALGLGKRDAFDEQQGMLAANALGAWLVANNTAAGRFDTVTLVPVQGREERSIWDTIGGISVASYDPSVRKEKDPGVKRVVVLGGKELENPVLAARVWGEARNYARWLNDGPANIVTPQFLAAEAQKIAKMAEHIELTARLDKAALEKDRWNLLLGVNQGSEREPVGICLTHYGKGKPIVLIGKAITFDTGGTNLKTGEWINEMRMDMSGAGLLLAVFRAWAALPADLRPKHTVHGIFVATENMLGGRAQLPQDVLVSRSGKTVEIDNTDAEGRLTLADAMDYGHEKKPALVLTVATLTGACMVALGVGQLVPAGLFANAAGQKYVGGMQLAASRVGERVWHLPSSEFGSLYPAMSKSSRADLKNTGDPKGGGASSAAAFLQAFAVKEHEGRHETPYLHLDIAGTMSQDKRGTGVGAKLLGEFLRNVEL